MPDRPIDPDPTGLRAAVTAGAVAIDLPAGILADALALLDAHPALLGPLAEQVDRLVAAVGTLDVPDWPAPVGAADLERFQLLALLATVPSTRSWFSGRGVSDDVIADTLDDLPVKVRDGIAATGADWMTMVVTGRVFSLGRLQFEPRARVPGTGEPAWSVHIPELGPLDPAACDASFARAPGFFAAVLGDTATRAFVCHSWLMDDQLRAYLPAESNILRFQRRFALADDETTDAVVGGVTDGDTAVAKFVFRAPLAELAAVTPSSRLEAAVLEHLAAGGYWRERTGVFRL